MFDRQMCPVFRIGYLQGFNTPAVEVGYVPWDDRSAPVESSELYVLKAGRAVGVLQGDLERVTGSFVETGLIDPTAPDNSHDPELLDVHYCMELAKASVSAFCESAPTIPELF